MFASEYHWSKEQILDLYVDEVPHFYDVISKRKEIEYKQKLNLHMQASAFPNMQKNDQKKLRDFVTIKEKVKLSVEEERQALLKLQSMVK